jgi:hypothetical protein
MKTDQVHSCPICKSKSELIDVLDFNKVCGNPTAYFEGLSGVPIYYALCGYCGFCFAPAMAKWEFDEFEQRIYNADYIKIDPDCVDVRPRQFCEQLIQLFPPETDPFTHLDYGGGNGLLSKLLCENGWNSTTFDPFINRDLTIDQYGKYDLITAFEVFEHVPNVDDLLKNLQSLLAPRGVIYFSTQLSDGHIHHGRKLDWWYAAPRNGHISLFSKKSLQLIAEQPHFTLASNWVCFHALYSDKPTWAAHLIP